jgi:hypothetical protein
MLPENRERLILSLDRKIICSIGKIDSYENPYI